MELVDCSCMGTSTTSTSAKKHAELFTLPFSDVKEVRLLQMSDNSASQSDFDVHIGVDCKAVVKSDYGDGTVCRIFASLEDWVSGPFHMGTTRSGT